MGGMALFSVLPGKAGGGEGMHIFVSFFDRDLEKKMRNFATMPSLLP